MNGMTLLSWFVEQIHRPVGHAHGEGFSNIPGEVSSRVDLCPFQKIFIAWYIHDCASSLYIQEHPIAQGRRQSQRCVGDTEQSQRQERACPETNVDRP
jgi:hypothetical protein